MLKIWFLIAKYTHCFQKTKQWQNSIVRYENVCLLHGIIQLFEEIFSMQAEPIKTKFNLMSLSFYLNCHRIISLPHPLSSESVFLGVCVFDSYDKNRHGNR